MIYVDFKRNEVLINNQIAKIKDPPVVQEKIYCNTCTCFILLDSLLKLEALNQTPVIVTLK